MGGFGPQIKGKVNQVWKHYLLIRYNIYWSADQALQMGITRALMRPVYDWCSHRMYHVG